MNVQDCLQILRDIKDVAFATIDKYGMPKIRIIDIMIIEDEKIYFLTARGKEFYKELMSTGAVAITGLNDKWQTVRLHGKALRLKDQKKWIDRMFEENPSMKEVYPGSSRYILEPFVIQSGEIEFFDLSTYPIYRQNYQMGGYGYIDKGFMISSECTKCGKCARECPQQCIKIETTYEIEQSHCLHCGLCFEHCDVGAIKKRWHA